MICLYRKKKKKKEEKKRKEKPAVLYGISYIQTPKTRDTERRVWVERGRDG